MAEQPPVLLTPAETGRAFRVDPKTVARWARAGKLKAVRTLGGHRRFRADQVERLLVEGGAKPDEARGILRRVLGGGRG